MLDAAKTLSTFPTDYAVATKAAQSAVANANHAVGLLGQLPPTHGNSWAAYAIEAANTGTSALNNALATVQPDPAGLRAAFGTARESYKFAANQIF